MTNDTPTGYWILMANHVELGRVNDLSDAGFGTAKRMADIEVERRHYPKVEIFRVSDVWGDGSLTWSESAKYTARAAAPEEV